MDFESYIGRERQLLARIDRERAELNAHEPNAERGNYQLVGDELRLLQAGEVVEQAAEQAAAAAKLLDERLTRLRQSEEMVNARTDTFLKRVGDWEAKFDARYAEAMEKMAHEMAALEARSAESMKKIAGEMAALEARNAELTRRIEAAKADVRDLSEVAEANLRDLGRTTTADLDRAIEELRQAQAEFEASVNAKLESDQQTIERIKFMLSTMSEIIKT